MAVTEARRWIRPWPSRARHPSLPVAVCALLATMSMQGDIAASLADRAAGQSSEEHQTDAIGEGLAAVAYALLDIAEAIRELSTVQESADR